MEKPQQRYGCLTPEKKRTITVSARLNDDEIELLDQYRKAVKMKRGEYMREAVLRSAPPIIPAVNTEKWVELGRLGANLNQIARRLNQGEPLSEQIEQLRNLVAGLRIEILQVKHESKNSQG